VTEIIELGIRHRAVTTKPCVPSTPAAFRFDILMDIGDSGYAPSQAVHADYPGFTALHGYEIRRMATGADVDLLAEANILNEYITQSTRPPGERANCSQRCTERLNPRFICFRWRPDPESLQDGFAEAQYITELRRVRLATSATGAWLGDVSGH